MGNLLTYKNSFSWVNVETNRGPLIEKLSSAIDIARNHNDSIYSTPDLYDFNNTWGQLFEFLWAASEYDVFKERYNWISADQFQVLMNLPNLLGSSSNTNAYYLEELEGEHKSWLGLYEVDFNEKLVHDIGSWRKFHSDYVSDFSYQIRCQQFEYFKEFFIPTLKVSQNQINQLINRNQVDNIFERLDPPLIANEKIHIHFRNAQDCALNIDGTWKHEVKGFAIPQGAIVTLCQWGFLLPDEYYNIF